MALKIVAIRATTRGSSMTLERLVESPRGTRVIDGSVQVRLEGMLGAERRSAIERALESLYPPVE